MAEIEKLYQAVVRDHAANPRFRGRPARFSHSAEGVNPLCGDRVTLYAEASDDGSSVAYGFEAAGCALVNASASLLCQTCRGQDRQFFEGRLADLRRLLRREECTTNGAAFSELGELEALAGVRNFPSRHRCVLLPWETAEQMFAQGGATEASPG